MKTNLFHRAFVVAALVFTANLAAAGEIKPYSPQEFDQLTHAGKPVVLDISASWCPTCKAQKPIVDKLLTQPAYRDVTLLAIDFDSDKPALRRFKVSMQSTLVAFKGTQELARSVGDTSPQGIEDLFRKAAR